jgi:(p)ppGpp synthase/HD superfamily hydrolase
MEYQKCLDLIKEKHFGQTHANNVPVWHHLERVSSRLKYLLDIYNEGEIEERNKIILSALGHDVLEDTNVTKEEIISSFANRGYEIIFGMTNESGDNDVRPYVKKVTNSEEAVRLIKLSDLLDNITSVTYNIAVLTPKWVDEYFLPIVTPMKVSVLTTSFDKYPKTGEYLKLSVECAYKILLDELNRFK